VTACWLTASAQTTAPPAVAGPGEGATPDHLYTVVPHTYQPCWAITDLRGAPSCDFTTTWQEEAGYYFGGTARCPDDREFGWNVRIVQ